MVLIKSSNEVMENSFHILKFIQDMGPTFISLIATYLTFWVTKKTLQSQSDQNIKTLNAQKDFETRQLIRRKLDEFYGPLLQQRIRSTMLYEKFSAKFREVDENFSTLLYLLKSHKFEGNDKILLEQIIQLGKESEKLIQEKSGLIDDSELRLDILPKATIHFLLIRLAYEKILIGNPQEFSDLSYPYDLTDKLEFRKSQLEAELDNLNKREN